MVELNVAKAELDSMRIGKVKDIFFISNIQFVMNHFEIIKHTEIEFLSSFMLFIPYYFNRQCIIKRLETCISYQTKKMLVHIYKVFALKFLIIKVLIPGVHLTRFWSETCNTRLCIAF